MSDEFVKTSCFQPFAQVRVPSPYLLHPSLARLTLPLKLAGGLHLSRNRTWVGDHVQPRSHSRRSNLSHFCPRTRLRIHHYPQPLKSWQSSGPSNHALLPWHRCRVHRLRQEPQNPPAAPKTPPKAARALAGLYPTRSSGRRRHPHRRRIGSGINAHPVRLPQGLVGHVRSTFRLGRAVCPGPAQAGRSHAVRDCASVVGRRDALRQDGSEASTEGRTSLGTLHSHRPVPFRGDDSSIDAWPCFVYLSCSASILCWSRSVLWCGVLTCFSPTVPCLLSSMWRTTTSTGAFFAPSSRRRVYRWTRPSTVRMATKYLPRPFLDTTPVRSDDSLL